MKPPVTFHDLKDRSVFIAGGGSGIGAAVTEGFLRQGARVAFADIADSAAFADAMAHETGNRPLFLQCDVTDTAAFRATMDRAAEAHGPISVLVNVAANDDRHRTADVTEDYWDWCIAINLKCYFFAVQHVVPMMKAAGGGAIVNFSSISYMMGLGDYAIYTGANAAITAMTRGFAREFGGDRIRVNAVAPGWVLTERQKRLWVTPEALSRHLDRQCLKEAMEPDDVVGGVLFLASDTSRMMTGQVLVIDGGVVVTG
ncbi:MAG: SDR family oxidoreductase [Rhodobacteraceae bacterium]|nr:SDR family oxidoreductase [Paracoccaceae bacterium]